MVFSKTNTVKVLLHTQNDLRTYSHLKFTLRKMYKNIPLSQCRKPNENSDYASADHIVVG